MPVTLTETSNLVSDITFKRRVTAAFVRRAGLYLQQGDAALSTAFPAWSASGVRTAAFDVVRNAHRDEMQTRLAYLICAVPSLKPGSADAEIETAAMTAFASLLDPISRNP